MSRRDGLQRIGSLGRSRRDDLLGPLGLEDPQEKNTNRRLGQYYLRDSEIALTCLDRPLAGIS